MLTGGEWGNCVCNLIKKESRWPELDYEGASGLWWAMIWLREIDEGFKEWNDIDVTSPLGEQSRLFKIHKKGRTVISLLWV